MPIYSLPFEKPLLLLNQEIAALRAKNLPGIPGEELAREIARKEEELRHAADLLYANLSAWERVQIARHPLRPNIAETVEAVCDDFFELHGDRHFADDQAIYGGLATFRGRRIAILGTRKGRDTKSNLACNFGCPFPEGYRKALRLMKEADKFGLPIVTIIDTAGAFPGIEGEERHVAEAIAVNIREMFGFSVPIVSVVSGEGGSGGALALGVCDRLLLAQYAYYSVISPEGCAAILWKDRAFVADAAKALKLTAEDLKELGLVDGILPEPLGGAHNDPAAWFASLADGIEKALGEVEGFSPEERKAMRYDRFRAMGVFAEAPAAQA
jgi:acetyl-CoA carboxylase carboxyl transferase subunit alpha